MAIGWLAAGLRRPAAAGSVPYSFCELEKHELRARSIISTVFGAEGRRRASAGAVLPRLAGRHWLPPSLCSQLAFYSKLPASNEHLCQHYEKHYNYIGDSFYQSSSLLVYPQLACTAKLLYTLVQSITIPWTIADYRSTRTTRPSGPT